MVRFRPLFLCAIVAIVPLSGLAATATADGPPDIPPAPGDSRDGGNADQSDDLNDQNWRDAIPFRFSLASTTAVQSYRTPDVSLQSAEPGWTQRLDAGIRGNPSLSDRWGLRANLRLRTAFAEGRAYRLEDDTHLDTRELALDYRVSPWLDLEFGRLNVRNGVATGFNPNDWARNDSVVVADSFDVVDRRRDRLGSLVSQAVVQTPVGIGSIGYRPEISASSGSVLSDADVVGLNLDRTNDRHAVYGKFSPYGTGDWTTTIHTLFESSQPGAGLEVSGTLSDSIVVFAEWFGQHRFNHVDESRRDRGGLDDAVAASLGANGERRFNNQVALGATWSMPFEMVGNEDISLTAEYHFNQAGLSGGELSSWFDAGADGDAAPGPLWGVRGIANQRQEPLMQHQLFFRFAWNDAFHDVDMSAISFVSPVDRSALVQGDLDVEVLDGGDLGLSFHGTLGGSRTAFGSQQSDFGARLTFGYSF